jgi:hypothetical protein
LRVPGRKKKKKLGVPGKGAEISRRGVAEWDGDAYRPKGLHLAKPRGSTEGDQTNELLPKIERERERGEREEKGECCTRRKWKGKERQKRLGGRCVPKQ